MIDGEERRRRRQARELERRMRELDELDRRFGLGALPGTTGPREVRRSSHRVRNLWVALVTLLLVGGVVAVHPSSAAQSVRDAVHSGLTEVGLLADEDGTYTFMQTQRGGRTPVGYDPCEVIDVVVNPEGAPDAWREMVDTAIEHVEEPSGLDLEYAGETGSRDFSAPRGADREVIVAWATEDEVPALAGRVAGVGGSAWVEKRLGHREYVSGSVLLDRDVFAELQRPGLERATAQAVVDHEFGHLVGLGHVDDRGELMHPSTSRKLSWGPGDREGLALLGAVDCG